MSFRVSGVIHIIGYILMMQMFSSIHDVDSDFRALFRSKTFQRFIYFNNIQHFVHMEGDSLVSFRVNGVIHIIEYILMM